MSTDPPAWLKYVDLGHKVSNDAGDKRFRMNGLSVVVKSE